MSDAPAAWSEKVRAASQAYFRARDRGELKKAHAFFEASTPVPLGPWSADKLAFNQKAGAVIQRKLHDVTWYRNPAGAPEGIYGAVDFDGEFKHLEVHCGYLMWRLLPDQRLELVSETESHVDKDTAAKMAGVSREAIRAKFGCRGGTS